MLAETELDGIATRCQDAQPVDILKLIDHIAARDEEIERLREKHIDEIHFLCCVLGQTASCLRGLNRAVRQVAINAIEYHGWHDLVVEYELSEPMKHDKLADRVLRLRKELREVQSGNERLREALKTVEAVAMEPQYITGYMATGGTVNANICPICKIQRELDAGEPPFVHADGCPFKTREDENEQT